MSAHICVPRLPLSEFVELFWLHEGSGPTGAKERLLPTGSIDLVINLREDVLRAYDPANPRRFQRMSGAVICGPHSRHTVIDAASGAAVVGVHFKPGGAAHFLKMPAAELHNEKLPFDAVWGRDARGLRDQLLSVARASDKFSVLERFLLMRLVPAQREQAATALAIRHLQSESPIRTISTVAHSIGLTQKRLVRLFRDRVGLSPKQFCRLQRFSRLLNQVDGRPRVDWSGVALDCGYYDQSHMVHEFQEFSGLSPTAYLQSRGIWPFHVPFADPS